VNNLVKEWHRKWRK